MSFEVDLCEAKSAELYLAPGKVLSLMRTYVLDVRTCLYVLMHTRGPCA